MKYWQIIADNLSKVGWSWCYVSAIDCRGRTIWIADAHRDDGKRFIVRAEEILTAFLELERVTRKSLRFQIPNNSAQFFHDSAFIGLFPDKQTD